MDDKQILGHIDELIQTEHELRKQVADGKLASDEERAQLRQVEESLDQCWDLLRQRRARREFGEDPGETAVPPRLRGRGLPAVAEGCLRWPGLPAIAALRVGRAWLAGRAQ